MASLQLSHFPEELVERILAFCAVADPIQLARPSWHRTGSSPERSPPPTRGRLALLLVSKSFLRICTPLFYDTLCISSLGQLQRLLASALHFNPGLVRHVRRVVLAGTWSEAGDLLRMCAPTLKMLTITLDVSQLSPGVSGVVRDLDAEEFCDALSELQALKHLVIHKPHHVYLTHPKPRYILTEVAKAMQMWDQLEHADVAFRLSDDSGAKSSPAAPLQPGPMTALTESLSSRPKLRTFSTILPSVWNEAILRVSVNPSLERIILTDGHVPAVSGSQSRVMPPHEVCHGIAPTSLFMLGAKKHARLNELIRAGTSIVRMRAQTLGPPVVAQAHYPGSSALLHAGASGSRRPMPSYHCATTVNTSSLPVSPIAGGSQRASSSGVSSKQSMLDATSPSIVCQLLDELPSPMSPTTAASSYPFVD